MEISMTQGEANRKALAIAYGYAGKAYQRTDSFNRIVEVAAAPTENGKWSLIATRENGLRVCA